MRTTQLIYSCESGRMVINISNHPIKQCWFVDVVHKVKTFFF